MDNSIKKLIALGEGNINMIVAASVGLGAIIGAGIFVLSGTAIALAGANALWAFILVGIVAILVAFELGELGSIMPKSEGASYSYVYNAFGSELGFITGILLYFSYATSISAVAVGFGAYLSSILGLKSTAFSLSFSIALIFVLTMVNLLGIKKAAKADFGLVVIKISILIIFILFALIYAMHSTSTLTLSNFSVSQSQGGIGAIFAASVAIFFAYSGFQTISTFVSKVKGGAPSAAKAIIISVLVSIVLYMLVVFALLLLLPASRYSITADPLSFALKSSGAPTWLFIIVDIGALIATASATLAMILSSSRILYQISNDKLLPKQLRKYNKRKDVAANGVILSAIIGVIMLFSGNLFVIVAIANFGLLFSYLMASLAVIHFRRIKKSGSFKIPFYPYIPAVTIVAILAFMYGMPRTALMIGVVMILALIVLYYFLREVEEKKIIKVKLFK